MTRNLTLRIFRHTTGERPRFDTFRVSVPDAANVLDAIEAAWAQHDRALTFRHACHHASCGSCAVRINGIEKLPCITPVANYPRGELRVEPLRNFPLISDLVVDVGSFFQRLSASGMLITRTAEASLPLRAEPDSNEQGRPVQLADGLSRYNRFENCIECGICVSACPTMAADDKFFGPAGLAAIYRARMETDCAVERTRLLELADGEHGVWRCHSGWECTEACPQGVNPAEAIMSLRRDLLKQRLKKLFGFGR